ncbi:MAG: CBS domain-containing protein [archaeon]|nr:CBS domain-containing protein [archaeon]
MPKKVKILEIMSNKPVVINADDTVQDAAILMRKNDISGLVVVNENDAVAVVTFKDIGKKVIAENLSPRDVKVKDVMSSKMITAQDDETMSEVAMKMVANGVSRMPVLDKDNNVAGVVTKTDILKIMPSIINIFYEKEKEKEITPVPDRMTTDGICEECGNHSDELKLVEDRWLCEECEESQELGDA